MLYHMKKLVFRLVFPLTFISYMIFEKWWFVIIVDGPDKKAYGFPLINCFDSLASSLEHYYFIFETVVNISVFTLFWFVIVYAIDRYIFKILISNILAKISLGLLTIYLFAFTLISINFNTRFFLKCDFDVEAVIETGYHFTWTGFQPDYSKINDEQGK